MSQQAELDMDRLRRLLHGVAVGQTVDYLRSVESTMPLAHERAQDAAVPPGHIVVAEQQTAGKGRRGRTWVTPYGAGLLVSVALKPPLLAQENPLVPMAAGLAVAASLIDVEPALDRRVALKWPNDVLLDAGTFTGKVAGILAESAIEDGAVRYAVLGIGINVNQTEAELPTVAERMTAPVSLRVALNRTVDRTFLLAALCRRLASWFGPEASAQEIRRTWRANLTTLGQWIDVYSSPEADGPTLSGRAVDVTENGELLVEDAVGTIHAFSAADVSVRSSR